MTKLYCVLSVCLLCLVACAGNGGTQQVNNGNGQPPEGDAGQGDAGQAAPVRNADGQCLVVGQWVGTVPDGPLANETMNLEFFEGGRARGVAGWVTLHTTWQRIGDVVEIAHVDATPAMAGCPPEDVGRYTLSFEPDCGAVVVTDAEDACEHRRLALNHLRAARQ